MNPAEVSTELGSVAVPLKVIGVPTVPLYGPLALAVGATLVTWTELLAVALPPSLSVTVTLIT